MFCRRQWDKQDQCSASGCSGKFHLIQELVLPMDEATSDTASASELTWLLEPNKAKIIFFFVPNFYLRERERDNAALTWVDCIF